MEAWIEERIPRIMPPNWHRLETSEDGAKWFEHSGMTVILSADTELDGRRWLHVSVARPTRLPSWDELRIVKDLFIGPDCKAIQVLPKKSEYVNIHPHVLHLWHCLDEDPLPDFTRGGSTL